MRTKYKLRLTNQKTINLDPTILFYVALAAIYINTIIGQTTIMYLSGMSIIMKIIRWIAYLLCVAKICTQTYSMRAICKIIPILCICFFVYYICDYNEALIGLLFILASQNIDIKKVAKEVMILTLVLLLLIILLAEFGVIQSNTTTVASSSRSYLWSSGTTIKLWGFSQHNHIGNKVLIIILCYIFLRYDHFKWFDLLPCTFAFYFSYFIEKSRTTALLIVISVILVLLFKLMRYLGAKTNKNCVAFCVYFVMLFSILFSLFMCITYDSSSAFYQFFDDLLTTRLSSAKSLFEQYGFSLFGQYINELNASTATAVLDNAYMHLFINYGLVLGILIIVGYFSSAKLALREQNYAILVIIATIFVCGICECWFYLLTNNPFLLLLSTGLYNQDLKIKKEDKITNIRSKIRMLPLRRM